MINKEELMNRILLLEPDLTQALLELISDYETKMIKLEKQDKILKIIFKKNVDIIHLDASITVENYNHLENVGDDLTEEEFDLLKKKCEEVLYNDK